MIEISFRMTKGWKFEVLQQVINWDNDLKLGEEIKYINELTERIR